MSLTVTSQLKELLTRLSSNAGIKGQPVIFNFRDPGYSAKTGGYHPVEIMLNSDGSVAYITDFSYVGAGHYAELCKELDFDFSNDCFQQFGIDSPLSQAGEIFAIWQQNFLCFYEMGVYKLSASPL